MGNGVSSKHIAYVDACNQTIAKGTPMKQLERPTITLTKTYRTRFLTLCACIAFVVVLIPTTAIPASPSVSSTCKGMTWIAYANHAYGHQTVHADSFTNAYHGDIRCNQALPMLCLNQDNAPVPATLTGAIDFYNGWARGNMQITPMSSPILGATLTSRAVADNICMRAFGAGWRMAEFHDGGGGWGWYAYGNISTTTRFWVAINDQPANPWNS